MPAVLGHANWFWQTQLTFRFRAITLRILSRSLLPLRQANFEKVLIFSLRLYIYCRDDDGDGYDDDDEEDEDEEEEDDNNDDDNDGDDNDDDDDDDGDADDDDGDDGDGDDDMIM